MARFIHPMRKKILKIYAFALGIGLAYYIWIRATGLAIPCFYLKTTGLLCPGCGMTNMFLALAKLDFAGAYRCNPAMFLLFWIWNCIAVCCFSGRPAFFSRKRFLYAALGATIIVILAWGVLRNMA